MKQNMNQTEKALSLAEKIGGKNGLNCIAELDPTAMDQAKAMDENDSRNLPLRGVPVLIKDNIDVKDLHTTAGSLALEDNVARSDAPVIRSLRQNGAVILGKANMTEFANYVTQDMPGGYSSRGGQVLHAVNPELNVAGSSSGSAVAVAAGIVPMAVGTDTCHSITACAMFNGICGLKPPAGVLSAEGIIPIAKTLDSAGPMARNLSDTLKLYSAMRDEPLPELKPKEVSQLRIAVNLANQSVLPADQEHFIHLLLERLKKAGAAIENVTQMPPPELVTIMRWEFRPMLEAYLAGASASRKTLAEIVEYYEDHPDTMMKYGDSYLRAALDETPGGLHGEPYLKALKAREKTISSVSEEIGEYDAVLMTGPTSIMHFCGLPSVTVASPVKTAAGVNQAVIFYGQDEFRLYEAALAIEQEMHLLI
ncbi:MAG: amidase [Anaerolineaceae bacterium]|nr:amidase [Anaerolineaceae bacterium]